MSIQVRPSIKVTEFVREKINGKSDVVCVEWFFDNVIDAFNKMDEIKERGTFCDPFLTFVHGGEK